MRDVSFWWYILDRKTHSSPGSKVIADAIAFFNRISNFCCPSLLFLLIGNQVFGLDASDISSSGCTSFSGVLMRSWTPVGPILTSDDLILGRLFFDLLSLVTAAERSSAGSASSLPSKETRLLFFSSSLAATWGSLEQIAGAPGET